MLGVLAALGALHWGAGLSAAMGGIHAAGLLITPKLDASRAAHVLRWTTCSVGYSGLTGRAFALYVPLGWIGVALAVTAAGAWLTRTGV
ncbi:hypothetical protein ACF08N_35460 [Streptomyces sp. NPDC015127]|uniref:hypothetical protein n=1 Tax=Streptomyces sp. NPDC015127 TaxID=3364939 RepID=UPI0036FA7D63